jgi:hypothetical protein
VRRRQFLRHNNYLPEPKFRTLIDSSAFAEDTLKANPRAGSLAHSTKSPGICPVGSAETAHEPLTFSRLRPGISFDEVCTIVGEPDESCGSGVTSFVYRLNNGGFALLHSEYAKDGKLVMDWQRVE